ARQRGGEGPGGASRAQGQARRCRRCRRAQCRGAQEDSARAADEQGARQEGKPEGQGAAMTSEDTQGSVDTPSGAGLDEGEVAADYIEELLDICDLDGDIDIEAKNDRIYLSVS